MKSETRLRFHYGWVILVLAVLVVFAALGLARFSYTLVLPAMQAGLGFQNTGAGVLATANLIGYLAMAVAGGALASRFGARVVISVGLAVAGAGMLLTGMAQNFPSLAGWRALTGLGSGAAYVPVMGVLISWFAPNRRGAATGIAVAGSSFALIFASPVVARLLTAYPESGWRVSWYFFGGAAILIAAASWAFLRNVPGNKGLAPLGAGTANAPPQEIKHQPLQWAAVYRSPLVWRLGVVYVAYGFSYIIYMTFFVKTLVSDGGYTQQRASDLFMVMGWTSLVCGLLWGSISDRVGRKRALIAQYLVNALAFGLFALWQAPFGFTLSAVLFGLSAFSMPGVVAAACGDLLGPRLAPAAVGFVTLFFGVGMAVAPSIAGALADAFGSFRPALLLAAGVALLGAVGSMQLGAIGSKKSE